MTERLTEITVVDKDILDLLPAEMTCDAKRQYWFIGCPQCCEPGGLPSGPAGHQVTEANGAVTVSPSIRCKCGAHYFVRQSKIEWC